MTSTQEIRVFIADDHPIVRDGLRSVLERRPGISVVGEAANGRDAVTEILKLSPDVALIDLDMPQLNGVGVVKELRRSSAACRCVVLSMHDEDHHIFDAVAAGASGYLVKGASADDISRAIQAASKGQMLFGEEVAQRIAEAAVSSRPRAGRKEFPSLSDRDLEILERVAQGMDNTTIAQQLGYAPKTIRNLLSELLTKLDVADRAAAIRLARSAGLGDTRPQL